MKEITEMVKTVAVKLPLDSAPALVAALRNLVPPEKRAKIDRFWSLHDGARSLVGELMVRNAAMSRGGIRNQEVVLRNEESGKPVLAGSPLFHFNISHSGEWVACCFSGNEVGIDVERIQSVNMKSVGRFFSREEQEALEKKNASERLAYFFDIWTVKESYLKAIGKGLRVPLNSFTVRFGRGGVRIEKEGTAVEGVFFKEYSIDPDYRLHVCAFENRFADDLQLFTVESLQERFEPLEAHCFD